MPADFYRAPEIWNSEVERLFERKWHLVGHRAQIPNRGDYFSVDIAGESIIVVHGDDDAIRACYNVCRHRGARLCVEARGQVRRFVCPYHAWVYALDGQLEHAARMPEDFDPAAERLTPCHVGELEGLLFICLAEAPPDFESLFGDWRKLLRHYDLASTRVAHQVRYPVEANWKLVVENGVECHHCDGVHPVFVRTRSRALISSLGADAASCEPDIARKLTEEVEAWRRDLRELPEQAGVLVDDGPESDHLRSLSRLPLAPGYRTESVDGRPVAPLLGRLREYDGATTVMMFNPWSWIFISSDYAATFRWTAVGVDRTDTEMLWLVRADAEPGRDFDPATVARLHLETAIEDKAIIESVRDGVRSRSYVPGRLSRGEASIERFNTWYLRQLRGGP